MNEAWAWRPLGELFEIGAGKTMSAAARKGTDKTPFLRTSNVLWDKVDVSSVDEMSIPEHELPAKLLKPGDLLVCEGGEIGRAAIWNGEVEPMSFQNHLHRLRPIDRGVEPRFYVFFLQAAFTQLGLFEGEGNKTTIPNLSRSRLAKLEVPQPPLAEQQAISYVLGEVRNAIKVQDKYLTTARALRRATMHTLFTRGLHGESQKETEIGPIPESWKLVAFASVRKKLQYGTSVRCTYDVSEHPVLRIPNIERQLISADDLKYCALTGDDAAKYQLEIGDLIFIRTNGVLDRLGCCAVYDGNPSKALFASYLIRARVKQEYVLPHFAASFFNSDLGTSIVAGRATPASDGKFNLNTAAIDSLLLPLPPTLGEQRKILTVLEAINYKIDLHCRKRALLEELFRVLLYKLMTGEVRLGNQIHGRARSFTYPDRDIAQMANQKRTKNSNKAEQLTIEEIKIAAQRMFAASQAHQRASVWCMGKPNDKPPSIDFFFFNVVSFELLLISIEQSLRLFLLLHFEEVYGSSPHELHNLYHNIQHKHRDKTGAKYNFARKTAELGQPKGIDAITEEGLKACLRRHNSSYSKFKYFQLTRKAKLETKFEVSPRDLQILHCFALALIELNFEEMDRRDIKALLSMSPVPESEMTNELRSLKNRLT